MSVNPGATIDCSDRSITIQSGRIQVTDGSFTLKAVRLTVNASRSIEARCTRAGTRPGMSIILSDRLELSGFLMADCNYGGGFVTVDSQGDVTVYDTGGAQDNKGVWANGTDRDASGGEIRLKSATGNILLSDPVQADVKAGQGTAPGGRIEVRAEVGNITVTADMVATGRQDTGGSIELEAGGDVTVGAKLSADGRLSEGHGGEVALGAGDALAVNDTVSAQGGLEWGGGLARGGVINLEAGLGGIAINANLDATSGAQGPGGDGGAIEASSLGNVVVSSGVSLLSKSDANGGDGGGISLVSHGARRCSNDSTRQCRTAADCTGGGACQSLGGRVSVGSSARLDARGHTGDGGQGAGAEISLRGCIVSLAGNSVVDATGYEGGDVTLTGRGSLTIASGSSVTATGASRNGTIRLVVPEGTTPSANGLFNPTPTIVSDPNTQPCD